MKVIRPSATDRMFLCPASSQDQSIKIDEDLDVGRVGTAVHEALKKHLLGVEFNGEELIQRHRIEKYESDFWYLFSVGKKAIKTFDWLNVQEVEVMCEVDLNRDYILRGTPDVVGTTDKDELIIIDWKSGRLEEDHTNQLKSYAKLKLHDPKYDHCITGKVITVWLRSREIDVLDFDRDSIMIDWTEQLLEKIKDEEYSPSVEACRYCPVMECPAKAAMIRDAGMGLVDIDTDMITIDQLAENWHKIKLLKSVIEKIEKIMKSEVELNGQIMISETEHLYFKETQTPEIHLLDEVIKIAAEHLMVKTTDEVISELQGAIKLSKPKFLELLTSGAPRGTKTSMKADIMDRLDAIGAVTYKPRRTLTISKEKKAIE